MKRILCLILFLSLSPLVFGADINWSIQGGASASRTLVQGSESGDINNIRDDSESTNHQVSCSGPPGGTAYMEVYQIVEFVESALSITSVAMVSEVPTTGSGGVTEVRIDLYYSNVWNTVFTIYSGGGTTWGKRTDTQNGNWSNVTKIRTYMYGNSFHPSQPSQAIWRNFELRAWGPPNYIDIGLRIRTSSGTIKIGVKDLEVTHKLRIRKGNTTYGIPLISTSDDQASAVRVFDGANVKALPKVD